MALDKLVDSTQLDTDLTSVANAIRTKGGTSASLAFPAGFVSAVEAIPTGGVDDGYKNKWLGLIARNQTTIEDADVTSIGKSAFRDYTTLSSAFFPNATSVGDGAFNGCTALNTLKLPNLTGIVASNAFVNVAAPILVFPKLAAYPNMNAINSVKASTIDLGLAIGNINSYMFNNDSNLKTLILRKATLAPLININAFNNTPFASGKAGGTLYVPSALISSYQSATNWSTILGYPNNSIQAIEGSQYENYYADGTPIT